VLKDELFSTFYTLYSHWTDCPVVIVQCVLLAENWTWLLCALLCLLNTIHRSWQLINPIYGVVEQYSFSSGGSLGLIFYRWFTILFDLLLLFHLPSEKWIFALYNNTTKQNFIPGIQCHVKDLLFLNVSKACVCLCYNSVGK